MESQHLQNNMQSHAWRALFRKQFNKTKLCSFYRAGDCKYGDNCTYAHTSSDLTVAPDLTKTTLCPDWQRGCCQKNAEDCQFAHGAEELRVTPAFGSSFLRKRSEKIAQQQRQHSVSGIDNSNGTVPGSGSGENSTSTHQRIFHQGIEAGNSVDGLTMAPSATKKKKRKSKQPKLITLQGALVNSQCQDTGDMDELFRVAMQRSEKFPNVLQNTSTFAGANPTLLTTHAGGFQGAQPEHSGNGQHIEWRAKQVGAGLTHARAVSHHCESATEPAGTTVPQNLVWKMQMGTPYMGMDPVPQQVNLPDLIGAHVNASPPIGSHQFMLVSPSTTAQQLSTHRVQQTQIPKPAKGAFLSEKPVGQFSEDALIRSEGLNACRRVSPMPSCSTNLKSPVSAGGPDPQSPIHCWVRDPSSEFQLRPGHSSDARRGAGTPVSAASPEHGSPTQGWAPTPSTIASPDSSPMRTKSHMGTYPNSMPADMPNVSSVFRSSGQHDCDEGILLCRNTSADLPCF